MDPMLGDFELAAADRGMGDFQHGACPRYIYRTYCTVPPASGARGRGHCRMPIAEGRIK
jgi:hypothetical protein